MNLSHQLKEHLRTTLRNLQYPDEQIFLEIPPTPELGDRSCAVALALAKKLKLPPHQIAAAIHGSISQIESLFRKVEIAGPGYLNFFWSGSALSAVLTEILKTGESYGSSTLGAGARRLFEFVSANPTGPMNIVSARAAALGDSLVRLHQKIGFVADAEFYVNDAGRQVRLLGESVQVRVKELKGEAVAIPEGGYHGSYVIDIAKVALTEYGGDLFHDSGDLVGRWAANRIVLDQRRTLEEYGVRFNRWYFESELHENKAHLQVLEELKNAGHTYEKDGALFFKSTQFGDDEDRVIITQEGRPTYFLPDIAYHRDKALRGYAKAVDLLGPDHHGHAQRIKAAMAALGLPADFLEIIIVQQVNLLRSGQPVKMSKRAGEIISMDELLAEVGADAAKQIFLSRRWSSHLDFDIEVAKDRSEKSPVFYVQYAHARICSIFRKADQQIDFSSADFDLLTAVEEKELLRALSLFPDVVEAAALQYAPNRLNSYLAELATIYHRFYHNCRVLSDDLEQTKARLALCRAAQIVLKEGLRLLGMSAPETM
ncbi:MAG: arginine--tRNA ligase [bacterium]|nr:arginine--tRNA ligase [bacterium]